MGERRGGGGEGNAELWREETGEGRGEGGEERRGWSGAGEVGTCRAEEEERKISVCAH